MSRLLIQEQQAAGGTALPWLDLEAYAQECGRRMLSQLRAGSRARRVFFDRGLPDLIGYLRCAGRDVPDSLLACRAHYTPLVFMAPPWREIYVNDPERPQTYAEAAALAAHIRSAYEDLGFEIVDLARAPVSARVERIRAIVEARANPDCS